MSWIFVKTTLRASDIVLGTAPTEPRNLTVSCATWIHSSCSHSVSLESVLILYSYLSIGIWNACLFQIFGPLTSWTAWAKYPCAPIGSMMQAMVEVALKECTVPGVTLGVGKNSDRHVKEVMYNTWSVYCMGLAHFQRRAGTQGLFAHPVCSPCALYCDTNSYAWNVA